MPPTLYIPLALIAWITLACLMGWVKVNLTEKEKAMTQIKHTPGPWRVSNNELGYGEYDILAEKQDFPNTGIATVVDGRFSDIDLGSVALHKNECEANARLIAKAPLIPELVEALVSFIDDDACELDHHGCCQTHGSTESPCHMKVARELIAKAEKEV